MSKLTTTRTKLTNAFETEGENTLTLTCRTRITQVDEKTDPAREITVTLAGNVSIKGGSAFAHETHWVFSDENTEKLDARLKKLLIVLDPLQKAPRLPREITVHELEIDDRLSVGFYEDNTKVEASYEFLKLKDEKLDLVREVRFRHWGTIRDVRDKIFFCIKSY